MIRFIQRLMLFGARVCESRVFDIATRAVYYFLWAVMIFALLRGVWYLLIEGKIGEGLFYGGLGLFWLGLHMLMRIGKRAAAAKRAAAEERFRHN